MLPVQVLAGPVGDEELGAVGVLALVRHADHAAGVVGERPVELVREGLAPDRVPPLARAGRVPALEHEVADVAVEADAGVVAALAQLREVPHGPGRELRQQLEVDGAVVRGDARVAGFLDAAGLEHVFLVAQEGEVTAGVGGEAGGGEGGGGLAGRVLGGVVGYGF